MRRGCGLSLGTEDGVRSMAFVEAAVHGSALNWEPMPVKSR